MTWTHPARAHLAEQMAFVRDGPDQCGESAVPTKWTLGVLSLYTGVGKIAPLGMNEIAAKQNYLAALKPKSASRNGATSIASR